MRTNLRGAQHYVGVLWIHLMWCGHCYVAHLHARMESRISAGSWIINSNASSADHMEERSQRDATLHQCLNVFNPRRIAPVPDYDSDSAASSINSINTSKGSNKHNYQ